MFAADHETATSAVRNLNGTDVKGRPLRIDLADSDPFLEGKTTNRGELDEASGSSKSRDGVSSNIPAGVPVPPGSTALDVISNVIATMQPQQLMDIMGHMKNFVHNSPEQARNLLQTQPQLSYALFQAMLMNQIVDPSVLQVSYNQINILRQLVYPYCSPLVANVGGDSISSTASCTNASHRPSNAPSSPRNKPAILSRICYATSCSSIRPSSHHSSIPFCVPATTPTCGHRACPLGWKCHNRRATQGSLNHSLLYVDITILIPLFRE